MGPEEHKGGRGPSGLEPGRIAVRLGNETLLASALPSARNGTARVSWVPGTLKTGSHFSLGITVQGSSHCSQRT